MISHEECIAKLQEELWNSRPSGMCQVCGKPIVEPEKSALEQWEAFLEAGPAGEKEWHRRTLGRLLQLANYLLTMVAFAAVFAAGLSLVYGELWLVMRTFLWWLPALGALIVFIFLYDWWKRTRAK